MFRLVGTGGIDEADSAIRSGVVDAAARVRRIGTASIAVSTRGEALARLFNAVVTQRPGAWGFCNAHTVNMARKSAAGRDALSRMTLFNDGLGVDLASWLLYGAFFPENLNGTDLTPALLGSLITGTPIFLLGSLPGVAERAAGALARRFPNLRVAGTRHGYFEETEEPAIRDAIRQSGARLVLVGMGNPRQEIWAARNMAAIDAPLLCVGAFFDFAAGNVRRAPAIVRAFRSEWLFRLALEPRRLARRYLIGNLSFLARALRQRLSTSHDRSRGA